MCDYLRTGGIVPTTTITMTEQVEQVAQRVAALAAAADQPLEEFIERILRGLTEADVDLDHGLPVFRMPPGAPVLTTADVDRLLNGDEK